MMGIEISTEMTEAQSFKMKKAVLFYADEKNTYATVHDVQPDDNGLPVILPGCPATTASVMELANMFRHSFKIGVFMPETVLSVSPQRLVWWSKPIARTIFFDTDKPIGKRSGIVSHPGLVFVAEGKELYVYAVKGNKRPTPETELYQAPYFNVWDSGRICTGTTPLPVSNAENTIGAWEKAFHDSAYTHPNIRNDEMLTKNPKGSYAFWKDMLDGKYKKFPERVLVSNGLTITSLLNKMA